VPGPLSYWCEFAWLPDGVARGVRLDIREERITAVTPGAERAGTVLRGLTVPGMANGHSHAFHRALRGRTHEGRGSFWTWRDRMYTLASRLDPDSYYRLALGVYTEMVLAGYTSVGEFHYLHHAPGGGRYADPNAMSAALVAAAAEAGIRLTLLDTCYLTGGIGAELSEPQRRFDDGDAEGWAQRVAAFRPAAGRVVVGAAVHSVRAVPPTALPVVAAWARGRPLHVHLSEQRGENEDCLRVLGVSPTDLLDRAGVLGPDTVAVHATHLSDDDMSTLAETGTGVCVCPTTERDLGDGIGPARALRDAGVALSLGSDSHAVVDPFEEARELELHERLARQRRGLFGTGELLAAATAHAAIGWDGVGALATGQGADLVTVNLESARTAGTDPAGALFAASASDVRDVMVAGRWVVRDGAHRCVESPGAVLTREIGRLWA
jgi:formiminoglutamate deiminase